MLLKLRLSLIFPHTFSTRISVEGSNKPCFISKSNVGLAPSENLDKIIEAILIHKWQTHLVCFHVTHYPTTAMKSLPSSKEVFHYNSIIWKSTWKMASSISTCTSLRIALEVTLKQSTNVKVSLQSSIFNPNCLVIALGMMLTKEHVSDKAFGYLWPKIVHGTPKFYGSCFFSKFLAFFILPLIVRNIK